MKLIRDEVKYQQTQTIFNKTESRYVSQLYIRTPDPKDVAGNYSCTVSNLRGDDVQRLEIRGKSSINNGQSIIILWHCHNGQILG